MELPVQVASTNWLNVKAVMLASLRPLVKDQRAQHEVAWSWLWKVSLGMLKGDRRKSTVSVEFDDPSA